MKHNNIKYEVPEEEQQMVSEPVAAYGRTITIPVQIPTLGNYTRERLTHELTNFAIHLVRKQRHIQNTSKKVSWRTLPISDEIKSMSLGHSELSNDSRSDKEILAEILEQKYL